MRAPVLKSDRLIFKPLSTNHLSQDYADWLNDPEVYAYLDTRGNYTIKKLKDFLLSIEEKEILFWGIHLKYNHLHIGNIKIDPINYTHRFAEYGIMVGNKSEWGKGFAEEATRRILDYCFNVMNLHKINLGVVEENKAAFRLYTKLNFVQEGRYVKHVKYDGKYHDIIRMAHFNPNWTYDD